MLFQKRGEVTFHCLYPLVTVRAEDFREFSIRGGGVGLGKFLSTGGGMVI